MFAVVAIAATLLAGCGGTSGGSRSTAAAKSAPTTNLVVSSGSPAEIDIAPLYYANATNLWKKHGLNVSFSLLTPAAGVAALVSGSVDIFLDGTGSLKAAADNGKVVVTGDFALPALDIVVNPSVAKHIRPITSISKLKELQGLTFAGTSPGSLVDVAFKALMRKANQNPNIVYLGGGGLAALKKGEVGAAVLAAAQIPPAKADGMKVVGNFDQLTGGQGIRALVGVNKAFLAAHPAAVKQFADAYRQAISLIKTHTKQSISYDAKAISATTQQTKAAWALQRPYVFLQPVPTSEIKLDLQNLARTDPNAATASISDVVDNSAMN